MQQEAVIVATFALFAALDFLKDSHVSCGYSFHGYVSFLTWEWEE